MNFDRLKKSVGQRMQLQPVACRLDERGQVLPSIDDDWIVLRVADDAIELRNVRTDHIAKLGKDHIHHFTSNPQRPTQGIEYGFLTLNVQVFIQGRDVEVRPTTKPGERLDMIPEMMSKEDAVSRARALKSEAAFEQQKSMMLSSPQGFATIHSELQTLFGAIEAVCQRIEQAGDMVISTGYDEHRFVLTDHNVSVVVQWRRSWESVGTSSLVVQERQGRILRPQDRSHMIQFIGPPILRQHHFKVDVSRSGAYCWVSASRPDAVFSSTEAADHFVQIYIELVRRHQQGKLPQRDPIQGLEQHRRSR